MMRRAGEEVECVVTYLEMNERPKVAIPHMPSGPVSALVAADKPPAWYFLSLYDAVGREYEWTDLHAEPADELDAWLQDPDVVLYSFMRAGWPHGFFVLDTREAGACDISYFGLVPQAIGLGLGWFLLVTAVHMAWDRPNVERVTVDTNSFDHPRALPLYQKAGFQPVRRETKTRTLTHDREVIDA